ncbi:hypothetical protein VPHK391_0073 [Vibrio phage K391]
MPVIKATKKPVTIEAIQWTGENLEELINFTGKSDGFDEWFPTWDDYEKHVANEEYTFKVIALEGSMTAHVGDYIIKGVQGEFYPCKPEIFNATYNIHE